MKTTGSPRIVAFTLRGAAAGAGVGAAGMVIFAFAINEQTMFGSSILWSPFYALEGAIGGGLAGIVLGLLAFCVIPSSKKNLPTAE